MKEKIKKIIKNKYFKIIVFILVGLFILKESYAVYIDIYNFKQLEKAKPYLETIDENTKDFYNLKGLNEIFNANIQPIKNCYYTSNSNGNEKYIFGFKLESFTYIYLLYGINYYAYPKYDLPIDKICTGWKNGGCEDVIFGSFYKTIYNPCQD